MKGERRDLHSTRDRNGVRGERGEERRGTVCVKPHLRAGGVKVKSLEDRKLATPEDLRKSTRDNNKTRRRVFSLTLM